MRHIGSNNGLDSLAQGEFVAVADLEATFAGASPVRQIFVYSDGNARTCWR